ncbi:MAG: beta-ketoacyl-[acyl-carrier-protein] synthase II [Candidatus Omnitrophica bacterium CG07_land_8_20_14_0_80_42_15]|uniref:Beta-ketoacyl-[acyl-carrier-protein] synthase II n=1 Tax=Candidatus Aquitaenariimonas noxiae TaxID=1974741 RepID=A0A2J0KT32_9BACT|nr:MAG: beta-ketoacyl-[acyl-carrier-protein] synthase II [Candidatus Omnitrophica bacterium CG07_land_8_20_14_0_80_42_15]
MKDKRIVITGVGVLASNGIGKDEFWKNLENGVSGIKPVTLFDTSNIRCKLAGEISDFKPETFLGQKGLRNLDRSTKLALVTAKLAINDSGLQITEENTDDIGVSLGTTLGSVWSISEFDKEALREGPRSVNPAHFPNTVMNSPASQISIWFNIKGFNTTISSGFASSLDAIGYAMNFLELGRVKAVLAGGVEELCIQTYLGFYKIGHLAGSRPGKQEINCPYDKRRNGIALGEGTSILVLEELEHAKKRNAKIYGEVLGYGSVFDPKSRNIYNPKGDGAADAMIEAINDAGLEPKNIDYISSTANSTLDCDVMETRAIKKVFGKKAYKIPISSIKSIIGECFSAAGVLNVAGSVFTLQEDIIPPTINYDIQDKRCDLEYVTNKKKSKKVNKILVNSDTPTGVNSSVVVGKYEE